MLIVNYFVQIGGIEAIGEYMKKRSTIASLLPSMNVLNQLAKFLSDENYQTMILPRLVEALQILPKSLSEEEILQAKKEEINSLFTILEVYYSL